MTDRWFRVPSEGSGTTDDPHRPRYGDRCAGWSGFCLDSGEWVVRLYADRETLNGLVHEPDVKMLPPPTVAELHPDDVAPADLARRFHARSEEPDRPAGGPR